MGRRWWRFGTGWLALVLVADVVRAHEVGGTRFDAPIPLPFLFAGAGATVAVTAGWLAVSGPTDHPTGRRLRLVTLPERVVTTAAATARAGFFVLFLAAIAAGLAGPQAPSENVATLFVWPVWLKGLALVAALFGSPWRVLSPWRAIYDWLTRIEGSEIALIGSYPDRLGEWPALAGFLLWIGVVENLTVVPRSPRATAVVVAGYAALMVAGAVAFGSAWLDRADALGVLYRLFGRVAPIRIERASGPAERTGDERACSRADADRSGGELERSGGYVPVFRPPWQGCVRPVCTPALAAFVVGTIYTVSFDGFASTPEYQGLLFGGRGLLDAALAGPALYLVGFPSFVLVFVAVAAASEAAGGGPSRRRAVRAYAPTVLPIAVAYEVAHNYPFVARNLGEAATVLAGYVLAAPPSVEPLAWLSVPAFWTSQVLLVVVGHVVAVVAAHRVSVDRYPVQRAATRAHAPLTALMVGYTVLSLWIVSRPVVS